MNQIKVFSEAFGKINVFNLKDMCCDTVDMSVVNIKYFPICLERMRCAAARFPRVLLEGDNVYQCK